MRVAVFDLDGTLADTSADLIAAANAALGEAGLGAPLDPAGDRAVAFAGGRAMLREGLARLAAEADVDRLYQRLLAHYRDGIDRSTQLYDGAEAALESLAAAGWRLAVCTNKPSGLATLLLQRLAIGHRFAAILGADSLTVRKPDPRHLLETISRCGGSPAQAVLVGDTVTDCEVARAAGVPCVLVGFGPEGAGVAQLGPIAVLEAFADLPALLERLVPATPQPA